MSSDGVMQFRKDVYGIDSRLTALLADRLSRLRKSAAAAASGHEPARGGRSTAAGTD